MWILPTTARSQFVDLDGDQRADVCGRSPDGIVCSKSTGDAFGSASLWSDFFGDANGWRDHSAYWSTIAFPDLNNDKKADVCGGRGRHLFTLSDGERFGAVTLWTSEFKDDFGWKDNPAYYETLQFGNVDDPDSGDDICGQQA